MTRISRLLLVAVLVAWIAMPTVGSEGGENGGGTGVWILPRSSFVTAAMQAPVGPPRAQFAVADSGQALCLQLSGEMGMAAAALVDQVAGDPVPLPVSGSVVAIPATALQSVASDPTTEAFVLISDANQLGYLLRLHVDAGSGKLLVSVY